MAGALADSSTIYHHSGKEEPCFHLAFFLPFNLVSSLPPPPLLFPFRIPSSSPFHCVHLSLIPVCIIGRCKSFFLSVDDVAENIFSLIDAVFR